LAFLLATVLAASPAFAQGADVTATLDPTQGWARAGAYVPVRLRVTNRTDSVFEEVRAASGGPIATVAPFRVASAATEEKTVPIFFTGGDLSLTLEFLADGFRLARTAVGPIAVRVVPDDAALVAVEAGLPEPGDAVRRAVREVCDAQTVEFLSLAADDLAEASRCGALDAAVIDRLPRPSGRLASISWDGRGEPAPAAPAFPAGSLAIVQPEAYRLFAEEVWPKAERSRLWLWLGVTTFAVLAVGLTMARRQAWLAAGALVALAGVATVLITVFGEVVRTRVVEARVFYVGQGGAGGPSVAVERFTHLASRGAAAPVILLDREDSDALPLPLLRSAGDLFRLQGDLRLSRPIVFVGRPSLTMLHVLERAERVPFEAAADFEKADLVAVASRADVVRALRVVRMEGTDASGATKPLAAWAAEWKASEDSATAYAGRSLAWWADWRQEGDGTWILAWVHDEVAADPVRRLPALVVWPISG
jgi:hypothetical protein